MRNGTLTQSETKRMLADVIESVNSRGGLAESHSLLRGMVTNLVGSVNRLGKEIKGNDFEGAVWTMMKVLQHLNTSIEELMKVAEADELEGVKELKRSVKKFNPEV